MCIRCDKYLFIHWRIEQLVHEELNWKAHIVFLFTKMYIRYLDIIIIIGRRRRKEIDCSFYCQLTTNDSLEDDSGNNLFCFFLFFLSLSHTHTETFHASGGRGTKEKTYLTVRLGKIGLVIRQARLPSMSISIRIQTSNEKLDRLGLDLMFSPKQSFFSLLSSIPVELRTKIVERKEKKPHDASQDRNDK